MIQCTQLVKSFNSDRGTVPAVDGVSFTVEPGTFFTLLGPSGCGKSTTLRCIAGLEEPASGEIRISDQVVFSREHNLVVPPNKRGVGMVFQSYAIWPHMTVFENVALPLRAAKRGLRQAQIRAKVEQAIAMVRLDGMESRPAPQLSGGQQQRLALARALVGEPKVLLLDEPLSNLDAKLREHMRLELGEMLKHLNITTLYVTHDQLEALAMSHTVAVMQRGKIVQSGPPREIYSRPGSQFVAEFIGQCNFFSGTLSRRSKDGEPALVQTPQAELRCSVRDDIKPGDRVLVCVRPENITLVDPSARPCTNVVEGKMVTVAFLGEYLDCLVEVGSEQVRLHLHPGREVKKGEIVLLHVPWENTTTVKLE
ncbi:MAG TPA: ABC transporter ATP-binding protein [Candidatus Binatia bacterium]